MELSTDQILSLAPDRRSVTAAREVSSARRWRTLGRDIRVAWGAYRGRAARPYQVQVDLRSLQVRCSCPSRKYPCKHGLGLMLLVEAQEVPWMEPSAEIKRWVSQQQRSRSATATASARADASNEPTDPAEAAAREATRAADAAKRRAAREAKIREGVAALERWMADQIRDGLADLERAGPQAWERQAARMVDAQAPGVASRLRSLGEIPGSGPDWPERLLWRMGRLSLLLQAYQKQADLPEGLRADVRRLVGWTVAREDVLAGGERVEDDWQVLARREQQHKRVRARRTWLRGVETGREALVIQYAPARAPFESSPVPGTVRRLTLAYWPSAWPQRALVAEKSGRVAPLRSLAGDEAIEPFLDRVSRATAQQPWLDRFSCALRGVVPVLTEWGWQAHDRAGAALPLTPGPHWALLALSGGQPLDLVGEWNGEQLLPLAVVIDEQFHLLRGAT